MVRIWELYLKQHNKAKILPVIIPVVLYHGEQPWNIETNFISLFEDSCPANVRAHIPDFRFILLDISHLPDEEIKGAVLLRVIFKTLKYIFTPELRYKLPEVLHLFRELKDKTKGTEYFEVLLRYLSNSARGITQEELKESVTKIFIEGGTIMETIAEKLLKKGRKEGIEKGIVKGIEKGIVKGRKEGIEKGRLEIIKVMKNKGLPLDKIAEYTGLSRKEIEQFAG
jgi:predicted transposase/invertase (TIGR01784 family)